MAKDRGPYEPRTIRERQDPRTKEESRRTRIEKIERRLSITEEQIDGILKHIRRHNK